MCADVYKRQLTHCEAGKGRQVLERCNRMIGDNGNRKSLVGEFPRAGRCEGMDYEEALRAITINPAKICGIADKVGSLEVRKDADFTVYRTDPLSMSAKPEMVFAGGIRVV